MRAKSLLIASLVLSFFSALAYQFLIKQSHQNESVLAGKGADETMREVVEEMRAQWLQFEEGSEEPEPLTEQEALQLADYHNSNPDNLTEDELDLLAAQLGHQGYGELIEPSIEIIPAPPQVTQETQEPEVLETPEPPLRELMSQAEPLESRTAIRGKRFPYKIVVPAGWKILRNDDNGCAVSWNDEAIITLESGPWSVGSEQWSIQSEAALHQDNPLAVQLKAKTLTLDERLWEERFYREQGLDQPQDIMLLNTSQKQRGSYRIMIRGDAGDLNAHAQDIMQLLGSFRFPPDNFQPEDISTVRVYVDGELRQTSDPS
ncbi:MAG: hypothetical protein AAGF10_02495 [Verrucomicrobiota bacterium]